MHWFIYRDLKQSLVICFEIKERNHTLNIFSSRNQLINNDMAYDVKQEF